MMKKRIALWMAICMIALLAAACAQPAPAEEPQQTAQAAPVETPAAEETPAVEETEAPPAQKATVRLGGLKGPTSMGMVKLLSDGEQGLTQNNYEFVMAASADELTPKLLQGELDVLAVPVNLGAILYNNTEGAVHMAAVNTLGVVYILEKGGEEINSLEDLKGQTIMATGKGTTPEFALSYLLSQHGLELGTDVTVEWKSEPTETIAAMTQMDHAIVMLPQPFVTVAQGQVEGLRMALDLTAEWEKLDNGSRFITAGLVVRKAFAEENPQALATFLEEYQASTEYVNNNIPEAAQLVEQYDIVKAAVAEQAIPYCNIVYIDKEEMQTAVSGYLQTLYDLKPDSVGGAMPGDDFYYYGE